MGEQINEVYIHLKESGLRNSEQFHFIMSKTDKDLISIMFLILNFQNEINLKFKKIIYFDFCYYIRFV